MSIVRLSLVSVAIESDVKINTSSFVVQNAGKLRDYYRIGKLLGSGMVILEIKNRRLWRGQDVLASGDWRLASRKGSEEEPYGRG